MDIIKDLLFEDIFDKIPKKSNLVIFGANVTGEKIMNDLIKFKSNCKIIGFIDNFVKGTFHDLPIWTLKEFIQVKPDCDLVIFSTTRECKSIINILNIYGYKTMNHSAFAINYYRNGFGIYTNENYQNIINILNRKKDKELFDILFKVRTGACDRKVLEQYFNKRFNIFPVFKTHYLERINKNAVTTILDAGMFDGTTQIAFSEYLPNLEKIYGFEVIYDLAKNELVEQFIKNDKLEIIPYALGEKNARVKMLIDSVQLCSSYCEDISSITMRKRFKADNSREVNVITIDNFCKERNIKPDFIKMDIEGAELSALKGGISTIKKCRPQLAISIYHSSEDFINIPLYLKENLENYRFALGHYAPTLSETVLYAIPEELA